MFLFKIKVAQYIINRYYKLSNINIGVKNQALIDKNRSELRTSLLYNFFIFFKQTPAVVADTSDQIRVVVGESRADVVSFPREMANHHVQPAVCVLRPHQPPSPLPVVRTNVSLINCTFLILAFMFLLLKVNAVFLEDSPVGQLQLTESFSVIYIVLFSLKKQN